MQWLEIAKQFGNRTNMQIKNRYYNFIKKREKEMLPLLPPQIDAVKVVKVPQEDSQAEKEASNP